MLLARGMGLLACDPTVMFGTDLEYHGTAFIVGIKDVMSLAGRFDATRYPTRPESAQEKISNRIG